MRSGWRTLFLAAVLVASLVGPTAWGGSFDDPEIDDAIDDEVAPPGGDRRWADIRKVWFAEGEASMTWHVNVSNLSEPNDPTTWDVNFTTSNQTNWTLRTTFTGGSYGSEVIRDGASQAGAELSTEVSSSTIHVNWSNHVDFLDENATLTDTFAFADAEDVPVEDALQQACHDHQVLDCAPDDGFGRSFQLGQQPASGLRLNVTPTRVETMQNTSVAFTLTARNDAEDTGGNDTIDASYSVDGPAGFNLSLNETNVTLAPGASYERTLDVGVGPDVTANATHQLTVTLTPTEGVNRTKTVEIFVEPPPPPPPPYALSASIRPLRQDVEPGASPTFTIDLVNDGTEPDAFELEVVSGPGWARLSDADVELDPDGNATVTMTVAVPGDAEDGSYDHQVHVASEGDANVTRNLTATVEVDRPGGFVNELDRQLQALGLGGLVPAVALLLFVLILLVVVLWAFLGGEDLDLEVEADWSEEPEDDEGPGEGG